jgi:hypothetical protein
MMRSDESNEGDYRIYASAVPGPARDGYIAAVIVKRVQGAVEAPCEAFRDESLAGGWRWPSPVSARRFAVRMAQEVIREEPHRLTC